MLLAIFVVVIVILGPLVFVHELGHFVVARRNGVKASEFGFGFPPRIFGIQFLRKKSVVGEKKKWYSFDKWRVVWGGKDGDDENEQADLAESEKEGLIGGTIYSLNWIPLGGFVRIKGENGDRQDDPDSFASKGAWSRIKILAAGVTMNFIFAWLLLSIGFMLGAPEQVDIASGDTVSNSKIQISEVIKGAPADQAGLKIGDEIAQRQKTTSGSDIIIGNIKATQDYINANKGSGLNLNIIRGGKSVVIKVVPRKDIPEGQGALGISLAQTSLVSYPWYESIWKGARGTWDMFVMIIYGLFGMIGSLLVGRGASVDVSGPVGITVLTKDVISLGVVYLIQFAAILSVNLGIINALPIPALDGGRILFILIEKIKGSPVNQKVEQAFHTFFFALLILLMVLVTYKDVAKFF